MESGEIEELEKEMHEGAEASLKHVSLIISVLAVLVAVVTVMGHRTHTEAVLMQANATDQWNQYQARRLRVELNDKASALLKAEPGGGSEESQADLKKWAAQSSKWEPENDHDMEQAKDYESEVRIAEAKAARFDLAEALLEIAVVLASITLLTKKEMFALTAVVLGLVGLLIGGSAFLVR